MIGLLRFVSVANAAVWFGAAVFYTFWAGPAMASADVQRLLGDRNFPYYGGGIAHILLAKYFHLSLICSIIALLHLVAERLYLGRAPKRFWSGLMIALFWVSLCGTLWIEPKLEELHRTKYRPTSPPVLREAATRSFAVWHGIFQVVNVFVLAGVGGCLWRATNPPDELRFVGSGKFRG